MTQSREIRDSWRGDAVHAIRGGAILTAALVMAVRVFDYLMSDQKPLSLLLGSPPKDFIQTGGSAAVWAVGSVTTVPV